MGTSIMLWIIGKVIADRSRHEERLPLNSAPSFTARRCMMFVDGKLRRIGGSLRDYLDVVWFWGSVAVT